MTITRKNIQPSYYFLGNKKDNPELHTFLLNREPLNILDIGCRVPINLFMLYHVYKTDILKGVDIDSESECVKSYATYFQNEKHPRKEELLDANSFFDVYNIEITPLEDEKPKISNKSQFDSKFLFLQDSLDYYPQKEKTKFDAIIMSNLLHFFFPSVSKLYLEEVKRLLKDFGLIIVRVERKFNFDYEQFKINFEDLFPSGHVFEFYDEDGKWKYSTMLNISNLL